MTCSEPSVHFDFPLNCAQRLWIESYRDIEKQSWKTLKMNNTVCPAWYLHHCSQKYQIVDNIWIHCIDICVLVYLGCIFQYELDTHIFRFVVINRSCFIIIGTGSQNHWPLTITMLPWLLALKTWCKVKRRFWNLSHFPLLYLNHKRMCPAENRMF